MAEIIIETNLSCIISPDCRNENVTARLNGEALELLFPQGRSFIILMRDIAQLTAQDYRIYLELFSGDSIDIFHVGFKYEDFLHSLVVARNEMLLKDLLMQENISKAGVGCQFLYLPGNAAPGSNGEAEIRLYETAIVVLPFNGELVRIPYCFINNISDKDYSLTIQCVNNEVLTLSMLGREYEPLKHDLTEAINRLAAKTQKNLSEINPELGSVTLEQTAALMKDGMAASRKVLENIAPGLWGYFEAKMIAAGMNDAFRFLTSLGLQEQMAAGYKRGLMGEITGEDLWFLIPVCNTDPLQPGNALILESIRLIPDGDEAGEPPMTAENGLSNKSSGRATYLFRVASRREYPDLTPEQFAGRVEELIPIFNRCMVKVNFRREPIYLSSTALQAPKFIHYRAAVAKIPELQLLRNQFIGRVIHKTTEQWRNDLLDMLRWNVATQTDESVWPGKSTAGEEG